MKKIIALSFALSLAACGGASDAPTIAAAGTALLPANIQGQLQSTCAQAAPILATLSQSSNKTVLNTASYPAKYCADLSRLGTLPPTTDANTTSWLPDAIRLAAQLAGLAIPLL